MNSSFELLKEDDLLSILKNIQKKEMQQENGLVLLSRYCIN